MDKYKIIGSLGEGSFGRVYEAKQLSDGRIVALKIISKRGRSENEIQELRGECKIQKRLHHPNIIQMLDSFETINEIVVVTEFAHKALNIILGEQGYLSEDRVQAIVWDLTSALYYLHSHRVLHRDLKPQNILLDSRNKAKLCDFGFARNMSTGTHVLTSIKGTPLYMAPELIDELPYDHNADLWSLGCIIYELLVGAPPFCTASILHLIRLIKNEQVQWPIFLSDICISFLKGLLQKDPKKRLTWSEILCHPWVEGNILILDNELEMPLTKTLSLNTTNLKDLQRKEHANLQKKTPVAEYRSLNSKENPELPTEKLENLSISSVEHKKVESEALKFIEETYPIETEEWSVFLLKTIEEVMYGEMMSLTQTNLTNILVSPLKNSTTSPKVLCYVAKLFSIPFVVKGRSEETIESIIKVYLEVKLVPNLVYSSRVLLREKSEQEITYRNVSDLNDEDLEALEYIYLLISHLVHINQQFLLQFCDALAVLNIYQSIYDFLSLSKRRPRIVLDLLAILTHVLRKTPDNYELMDKILMNHTQENSLNLVNLLRHDNATMRERICYFMLFLGRYCCKTLALLWDENIRETLEALMFDSIGTVRNAAERCVAELKDKVFYKC